MPSTAVADLMESVAVFILSGRYIELLPKHFAKTWVAMDMMRPILEKKLGYQNPIYLVLRKTKQKKLILSTFLDELHLAHRLEAAIGMRMAKATICSIVPPNQEITQEARMQVDKQP